MFSVASSVQQLYDASTLSNFMECEIAIVRNVEDALGYSCGGESIGECADCGTNVCDLHAESCDLCAERSAKSGGNLFCASCCYQHMKLPHAKPMQDSPRPGSLSRRFDRTA